MCASQRKHWARDSIAHSPFFFLFSLSLSLSPARAYKSIAMMPFEGIADSGLVRRHQRALAGALVLFILILLLVEKHFLVTEARRRHKRHHNDDIAVEAAGIAKRPLLRPDVRPESPTTTAFLHRTRGANHTLPTTGRPLTTTTHPHPLPTPTPYFSVPSWPMVDFSRLPDATQSAACPIPELQPAKFRDKMGWGKRVKPTPDCRPTPEGPFAVLETADLATAVISDGSQRKADVVRFLDSVPCDSRAVYVFDELGDQDFTRLSSTMDAETRQNDLRDRFTWDALVSSGAARRVMPLKPEQAAELLRRPRDGTLFHVDLHDGPYVVAVCNDAKELFVRAPARRPQRGGIVNKAAAGGVEPASIQNVLHIMFDSTSLYALRRSASHLVSWMEGVNNRADAASGGLRVFPFKHYHGVSCCSPGNQIPMYSGNVNGEGDFFVRSEPLPNSRDWLWNIAKSLGFTTFFSLDNCPDKSARDYHAFPMVDARVVAPLCLAGVLLSKKEWTCLAGKPVDRHVIDGLESFWTQHANERKFAAVQFISPHEESEKQILDLDELVAAMFRRWHANGELNRTAVIFWSDHGINFGKYASTHDGEIEKMFPFANVILPAWFTTASDQRRESAMQTALRANEYRLTTPYDLYETARSILYFPTTPPPFQHDPRNPPLPRPEDSHIMASFQKDPDLEPADLTRVVVPANRSCWDANIPLEFCTCVPWTSVPNLPRRVPASEERRHDGFTIGQGLSHGKYAPVVYQALTQHLRLLQPFKAVCRDVFLVDLVSLEEQLWPEHYQPKSKSTAKQIWMKPGRDLVKVTYRTSSTAPGLQADETPTLADAGGGLFVAVLAVAKSSSSHSGGDGAAPELVRIDRLDAMTKRCGIVNKVEEQLCVCK